MPHLTYAIGSAYNLSVPAVRHSINLTARAAEMTEQICRIVVGFFGLLILGASIWGIVAPRALVRGVFSVVEKPWALTFAVAVRIVLGLALVLVARFTRFPNALYTLGGLVLVAAVAIPIVGRERIERLVRWVASWPDNAMRAYLLIGVAFGALMVYAVAAGQI